MGQDLSRLGFLSGAGRLSKVIFLRPLSFSGHECSLLFGTTTENVRECIAVNAHELRYSFGM